MSMCVRLEQRITRLMMKLPLLILLWFVLLELSCGHGRVQTEARHELDGYTQGNLLDTIEFIGFSHLDRRLPSGACRPGHERFCGAESWVEEWPIVLKETLPNSSVFVRPRTPNSQLAAKLKDGGFAYSLVPQPTIPSLSFIRAPSSITTTQASFVVCFPINSQECETFCRNATKHGRRVIVVQNFYKAPNEIRFAQAVQFLVNDKPTAMEYKNKIGIIVPGTIKRTKYQLELLRKIVDTSSNSSWLSSLPIQFRFLGKVGEIDYWREIEKFLVDNAIDYVAPRLLSDFEYVRELCDQSSKLLIVWSSKDYNPRTIYDGLMCNLPVIVTKQSMPPEELAKVGILLDYNTGNISGAVHSVLEMNWAARPFIHAIEKMTGHSVLWKILAQLTEVTTGCHRL